jgi:uncharacterized protein YggE
MKKTIILFCLISTVYGGLFAQSMGNAYNRDEKGNYAIDRNTGEWVARMPLAAAQLTSREVLMIDVNILMNAEADSYMAIFHLSQVGKTASQVDTLINRRINSFRSELNKIGITKENVFTDMLTFLPVYEMEVTKKLFSTQYNEIPKGFEMKKNIHVLFNDENILSDIVTAAAKNEIYDFVKVNYYVKDVEAVYDEMMAKALKVVKKKEAFQQQLGIDLADHYRYASDAKVMVYPNEYYTTYTAYTSNNLLSPIDINTKTKINAAEKNMTLFYSPIDYKNFDAVVNPIVLKPVVQFTYNLKVVYERNRPKTPKEPDATLEKVIENRYYILKPDGTLQLLNLK